MSHTQYEVKKAEELQEAISRDHENVRSQLIIILECRGDSRTLLPSLKFYNLSQRRTLEPSQNK